MVANPIGVSIPYNPRKVSLSNLNARSTVRETSINTHIAQHHKSSRQSTPVNTFPFYVNELRVANDVINR